MATHPLPKTLLSDSLLLLPEHASTDKTDCSHGHIPSNAEPVAVTLELKEDACGLGLVILTRSAVPEVLVSISFGDLATIRSLTIQEISVPRASLGSQRPSTVLRKSLVSSPKSLTQSYAFQLKTMTGRVLARLQAPTLRLYRRWINVLDRTIHAAQHVGATLEFVRMQCARAAERESKRERELVLNALGVSASELPPSPNKEAFRRATISQKLDEIDETSFEDEVPHPWNAYGYEVVRRDHRSTPGVTWLYLHAPPSTRDTLRPIDAGIQRVQRFRVHKLH